jgi:hypothetical protein
MSDRRFYGIYRGTVHSNNDPQTQQRLKLRIPQVFANEPTDWVWPKDSSTTNFAVPSVGQGVYVMFEGGDPNYPIYVGTFGDNKSTGSQIHVKQLSNQPSYPSSIMFTTPFANKKSMDLTGSIVDMATKLDLILGVSGGTLNLPADTYIGTVTPTEIGYLGGLTDNVQSQLDLKAPLDSPTFTGTAVLPIDTSIGDVTSTEIGYMVGVTSSIQDQLNGVATVIDNLINPLLLMGA